MYLFKYLPLIPLFLGGGFTPLVQCHPGHDSLVQDLKALMRNHPRNINARTHLPHTNNLNKRALSSISIAEGDGDALACTSAQVAAIKQGITEARALATAAISVLAVTGSEDSEAYLQWFGGSNSNAATRVAIKTNNYESLLADLDGLILSMEDDVGVNNLDATGLTFLCPTAFSSCAANVVAVAHNTDTDMQGNFIALCPFYFTLPSQASMLSEIVTGRFTLPSTGFSMVHEVQHLSIIVGSARRCGDQPDPNSADGCYSVECCAALADNLKISNAQNMAFFAADVLANPSRGAPPDPQSCAIQKRELSPGPAALLQKAEEYGQVYNRFRRQATTSTAVSSSISSSGRPSSSKPLTTSSGLLFSSKLPTNSSGLPSTSKPPTTASGPPSTSKPPTTSSGPPSSSKPPTTSSGPPTTSSAPPSTSKPPTTTSGPPSTSKPPTTSSAPPSTSKPPTTTSGPPSTSKPPTTSSGPPSTSKPPTTSSGPPSSSKPPTTSSGPPSSSKPPTTTSGPPSTSKPTTSSSTQPAGVPPPIVPPPVVPPPVLPPPVVPPPVVIPPGGGGGQNAPTTGNPPSTSKPSSTSSSSSLQSTSRCSTKSNKPFPTGTGPGDKDGLNKAQLAELLRLGASVTSRNTKTPAPSSTSISSTVTTIQLISTPLPNSDTSCSTGLLVAPCPADDKGVRRCINMNGDAVCVNTCAADPRCAPSCKAQGFKSGFCSNGSYPCICTNGDPTS